jgi:hypothetical protein
MRAREPPSSSLARAGARVVLSDRSRKKQASSAGNAPLPQMLHRAAELAPIAMFRGRTPWRSRLELREHPCGAASFFVDLWHATSLLPLMNWEMRKDTEGVGRHAAGSAPSMSECGSVQPFHLVPAEDEGPLLTPDGLLITIVVSRRRRDPGRHPAKPVGAGPP